ncbi:hypothetical protein NLM33_20600 [Bradyrhizobium sp. CCGUVB1N3]|nr:hypothetical protein [Bradyrhizobium sp. CCGUVB1N3]MCP3472716.1 hypothetical protein [Bradyrhizobium sp. CCGUVB1N3]
MSWRLGMLPSLRPGPGFPAAHFAIASNLEDIPNAIDLLLSIDQFNFGIE